MNDIELKAITKRAQEAQILSSKIAELVNFSMAMKNAGKGSNSKMAIRFSGSELIGLKENHFGGSLGGCGYQGNDLFVLVFDSLCKCVEDEAARLRIELQNM